jgi:hypothetical protein
MKPHIIFYNNLEIIFLLVFLHFSRKNPVRNMILLILIIKISSMKKEIDDKKLKNKYFNKKIKIDELRSGDILLYSNFNTKRFIDYKFIFHKYKFTHIALVLNNKQFIHCRMNNGPLIQNIKCLYKCDLDASKCDIYVVRTGITFTENEISDIKKNINNEYIGCIPYIINILKKYNKLHNINYNLLQIYLCINIKYAMLLSKKQEYYTLINSHKF